MYTDALKPKLLALRPEEFDFSVVCVECPYGNNEHAGRDCGCARKFEDDVKALVATD
jgi:hypothetical protein